MPPGRPAASAGTSDSGLRSWEGTDAVDLGHAVCGALFPRPQEPTRGCVAVVCLTP